MTKLTSEHSVEGRAVTARPSLFLLSLLALAFLLSAAPAGAAQLAPILNGTNPSSPGASSTPLIQGEVPQEGGETKVVGAGLRAGGPISRAFSEPNNEVKLYTDAACNGTIVGEGIVKDLEGVGIQVSSPVAPDSVTTFYARQGNLLEGLSPCSAQGLRYRQVTTPPGPPVIEAFSPASPANDNFPRLIGSADPEATVSVYAGSGCSGTPVATGSGATFATPGIQVSVPDNSESTFSARASLAGFQSGCSSPSTTYNEVTPPPESGGGGPGGGGGGVSPGTAVAPHPPRLRTIPGGWGNDNTPTVTGSAPGASTVRIYADPRCGGSPIAKVTAAEFETGLSVRVVDNDLTVLSAVSVAGEKASDCSDPVAYVEDSLAPRTRITMGPASKTAKRKAIFRFMDTTGNAPGTAFLCRIDRRRWKRCSSPLRLRNLKPKRHIVQVKATDPAGNVETHGAKRSFKVITRP
jgi:hypothetical protein